MISNLDMFINYLRYSIRFWMPWLLTFVLMLFCGFVMSIASPVFIALAGSLDTPLFGGLAILQLLILLTATPLAIGINKIIWKRRYVYESLIGGLGMFTIPAALINAMYYVDFWESSNEDYLFLNALLISVFVVILVNLSYYFLIYIAGAQR